VPARVPPEVGQPLAPDVPESYVLVDGSRLLAQYGTGSGAGRFAVVLAVDPGSRRQRTGVDVRAAGSRGRPGGMRTLSRTEDGTTYTTVSPPGSPGGFSGVVYVVDQPGDTADYLFFEVAND
jgi:hypothetical protein